MSHNKEDWGVKFKRFSNPNKGSCAFCTNTATWAATNYELFGFVTMWESCNKCKKDGRILSRSIQLLENSL